jgi:hypothetical protein
MLRVAGSRARGVAAAQRRFARASSVSPLTSVPPGLSPAAAYDALIARGAISRDAAQARALGSHSAAARASALLEEGRKYR